MEKLEIAHHKLITIVLIIITLLTGIVFGVRIAGATRGTDGMLIIIFSLAFLSIVLLFLIFTQLMHVHEDLLVLKQEHLEHREAARVAHEQQLTIATTKKHK